MERKITRAAYHGVGSAVPDGQADNVAQFSSLTASLSDSVTAVGVLLDR